MGQFVKWLIILSVNNQRSTKSPSFKIVLLNLHFIIVSIYAFFCFCLLLFTLLFEWNFIQWEVRTSKDERNNPLFFRFGLINGTPKVKLVKWKFRVSLKKNCRVTILLVQSFVHGLEEVCIVFKRLSMASFPCSGSGSKF